MEIYLDANATTAVFPPARQAALAVMADSFGNPSSIHGSGLKARAVVDGVRASARRVLDAPTGQLFFTSGATEGIQTSVLSALCELRRRRDAGEPAAQALLYGATEHKAVPQALHHWNGLLGLNLPVLPIPVDTMGRHDLAWLREHAPTAGLVCTMAANNETGVISELDAIADILRESPALWLVDGVQALGKLPLKLIERGIDYAPFSGHKFYAPKGIGLLYVRDGAPFTPLLTGGGQESGLRGGTENIAGIAALGAVLRSMEAGNVFQTPAALAAHRAQLVAALRAAFAGLEFNAPDALSLPTTLNFAVRGVSSRLLLDLFDAADLRVSGGSACSAAKAEPSYVLQAMGLPEWQTQAAVRLSFGALDSPEFIAAACARLQRCGEVLRARGLSGATPAQAYAPPLDASAALASLAAADDLAGSMDVVLDQPAALALLQAQAGGLWVDVREAYESEVQVRRGLLANAQAVPLSALLSAAPQWLALAPQVPVVFYCRSGNRSAQAARALRRLGHASAWSLAGGLAMWSEPSLESADEGLATAR
ncbi:aminotransferase class V-fold PLP-dependent enzyme [Acidovorax sp. CCYZU-2555]|uniref:aminotransferase class V-fold PLP-dependent enzyme n=1 Tax=Acidovorax sp. CCYZU-2555 TaxID=2835042 RepID=UPI001BD107E2|nr:aminotransferase class V-fold PLP-dependent enzyme [Acidovorax sp. CCYZU-2555]MBS7779397.1 aminotransferase class V-fold PLP-dependent enzyme [Acidovorax sp. CCYZU-2555]